MHKNIRYIKVKKVYSRECTMFDVKCFTIFLWIIYKKQSQLSRKKGCSVENKNLFGDEPPPVHYIKFSCFSQGRTKYRKNII